MVVVVPGWIRVWAAMDCVNQRYGSRRFLPVGHERSELWLWKKFGALKKSEWNHVGEETDLDGRHHIESSRG